METIKLTIDNKQVEVAKGTNLVEAAASAGIRIPTLCYMNLHDLGYENKPGACRICVVEVEGRKNLAPACKTVCTEGMVVRTHTPRVVNARRTVMELILSNHPNDCLTCTKNGHCELQRTAQDLGIREIKYRGETTKYQKDMSVSIVRDMDKCIMCRRCETACNEIQSVGVLSAVNRGFPAVVSTAFNDPIQTTNCINCGQCVAVCPTGALSENSNIADVLRAIADPSKTVVVQTAPAVRVGLGQDFGFSGRSVTGKMVTALRRLGFDYVFDTDFAADLTIMEEGTELLGRLNAAIGGDKGVKLAAHDLLLSRLGELHGEALPGAGRQPLDGQIAAADVRRHRQELLRAEAGHRPQRPRRGLRHALRGQEGRSGAAGVQP